MPKNIKKICEEKLTLAIRTVNYSMSKKAAARLFGVTRTTQNQKII